MITLLELHLEVTMVMKMECGKATMLQETLECRKSRQEKKKSKEMETTKK